MNIFKRGLKLKFTGRDLGQNLLEPVTYPGAIFGRNDILSDEHGCMGLRRSNILGIHPLIEIN